MSRISVTTRQGVLLIERDALSLAGTPVTLAAAEALLTGSPGHERTKTEVALRVIRSRIAARQPTPRPRRTRPEAKRHTQGAPTCP